jgi:hypothetical protein
MKTLNPHQTVGAVPMGGASNMRMMNQDANARDAPNSGGAVSHNHGQSLGSGGKAKPKSLKDQILPLLRVKKGDNTMTAEDKIQQWVWEFYSWTLFVYLFVCLFVDLVWIRLNWINSVGETEN